MISKLRTVVFASLMILAQSAAAFGNESICNIKFSGSRLLVHPTKGDFVYAGDNGFGAVNAKYTPDGKYIGIKLGKKNSLGKNVEHSYYLCNVYQAKNVGTASTLIFALSGNSACTNWQPFFQIQSAHTYNSCRLTPGNATNGDNLILE